MAKSTYAGLLLGSLDSESPRLRAAAHGDISDALAGAANWADVAARLRVSRDSIERLRTRFPWVFEGFQKSTEG